MVWPSWVIWASVLAWASSRVLILRRNSPISSSDLTWASARAVMTCSRREIWLSCLAKCLSVGMVSGSPGCGYLEFSSHPGVGVLGASLVRAALGLAG